MAHIDSIIVVSKEPWTNLRRARKQLLFEALLKESLINDILYMDPHRHIWQMKYSKIEMPNGMRGWQAYFLLPGERYHWVRTVNRWFIAKTISNRMSPKKQWFSFIYNPWDVGLIHHMKRFGPVLFDWTEDWSVYHNIPKMGAAQKLCIQKASLVLAVTEKLAQQAADLRGSDGDILLLPNATTLPILDDNTSLPIPNDIAKIPEPRIGYVGHIGPWFNADLLINLSMHKTDWNWVLVGGFDQNIASKFELSPNIHLLGEKPLSKLQAYLSHFQVLFAPYKNYVSGDASKLYDYITVSKPIITSDIETARRLKRLVHIASTFEQWVQSINHAISAKENIAYTDRKKVYTDCTWSKRANTLIDWLSCYDFR